MTDPTKTLHSSIIHVWGTASNTRILDTTLSGNKAIDAGILVRQPEGLILRRIAATDFQGYGVMVDANQLDFSLEDIDVARVSRPVSMSSNGTAEACIWIGNTATARRLRVRDCAWTGIWVGTAAKDSWFSDLDIDRTSRGIGLYIEHFAPNVTFERITIGATTTLFAALNVRLAWRWTARWDRRSGSCPPEGGAPVKVDFEEHDFDRMDLGIFDPVFDLASFSMESRLSPALEDVLIGEYMSGRSDASAPRRLPHYKLMAGVSKQGELRLLLASGGSRSLGFEEGLDRTRIAVTKTDVERQLSSTANHWLARALRSDEPSGPSGKIFALDVDGVLEDGMLGFSATTPAGTEALRVMKRHGFTPVLATGRSVGEVIDGCHAFRLCASVAEYSSVVWIDGQDRPTCLVGADELDQLRQLRDLLAQTDEAIVDPAYESSVRVFRYCGGLRRAMPLGWMQALLRAKGLNRLRVIPGEDQLDVVGSDCNKGRGVCFVKQKLGGRELHAAGDTIEDVAMLRLAEHAYAPANIRPDAVAAVRDRSLYVARHKRQRGLLEIARVAAHKRRRACRECGGLPTQREDATLLRAFGIRDPLLDPQARGGRRARRAPSPVPEPVTPMYLSAHRATVPAGRPFAPRGGYCGRGHAGARRPGKRRCGSHTPVCQ